MADDPTQVGRRLRIDTALNAVEKGDPFLLIAVHGIENFSQPYRYDISMLRLLSKPRLDPANLINTIAKIGVQIRRYKMLQTPITRNEVDIQEGHSLISRFGVFDTLTDDGQTDENFRTYSAVLVPAFQMMEREIVFRVFEQKNVRTIIREVTRDFPNLAVNQDLLEQDDKAGAFPIMEYCVQFRESSFNFLSRLMAQFGIWYYFEHHTSIGNCTMVLGRSSRDFKPCQIEDGDLKGDAVDGLVLREKNPSLLTITEFKRVYAPAQRMVRSGNFNIIAPVSPIDGKSTIRPDHDLIGPPSSSTKGGAAPPIDSERFRTEVFPADARVQSEAQHDAEIRMQSPEGQVFTATGSTRNAAFMVGRRFHVAKKIALPQEPGRPDIVDHVLGFNFDPQVPEDPAVVKKRTFLLVHLEFRGGESFYSQKSFFETLFGQAFDPNDKGPDAFGDLLLGFTTQGLNNYLQNEFPYALQNNMYPETQLSGNQNQSVPYLIPFAVGGGLAAMTGLIPALRQGIADLFKPAASDYTNSFHAVPLNQDGAAQLPPPIPSGWVKPIANGPHLAVVIGPDGVEDPPSVPSTRSPAPLKDIHADKLGRVRVRFPWDRKPDEAQGDQFKRGDNTCWARVSEGWAGRNFGSQFLPRVGQEVIVDFIDGDPDRPIITGRVYNADHSTTNLPFPGSDDGPQSVNADDLLKSVGLSDRDFRYSGLKTRSVPSRDDAGKPLPERFHLLRLNDDRKKEQYLIRSQWRMDVTVRGSYYDTTGQHRHVSIGGFDSQTQKCVGDHIAKVYHDYDLHVGDPRDGSSGSMHMLAESNYELRVKKATNLALDGGCNISSGDKATISIYAGKILLEAKTTISLKVGSHSVVIDAGGVWSDSKEIKQLGGPAEPAIPAGAHKPHDPELADTGESQKPIPDPES